MIKELSELLTKLISEEKKHLDEYELKHAPTIGSMYEGLTADVLRKTIPLEINLNVVSGFVTDDSGMMSNQIDCMIVKGNGENIPYTDKYKWHIKDVIAVFEVKKSLYTKEFDESYNNLKSVLSNLGRYIYAEDFT